MYKSTFKEYIGSHTDDFRRLFGQNKLIRSIVVGTMIITSDNKWIVGRRLNTFEYEGCYALKAGCMDPTKDMFDSKPDSFFAIKGQLKTAEKIILDDTFVCLNSDHTYEFSLYDMIKEHRNSEAFVSIALLPYKTTLQCSMVLLTLIMVTMEYLSITTARES
jgi:hypothetical protein